MKNRCSIELMTLGGGMLIDQSLDVTLRGDLDKALKVLYFLFPETKEGEQTIYGINRDFLRTMRQSGNKVEGKDEQEKINVRFRWNKDSHDIGHLINAIRVNGGASRIERELRGRQ